MKISIFIYAKYCIIYVKFIYLIYILLFMHINICIIYKYCINVLVNFFKKRNAWASLFGRQPVEDWDGLANQ